ncbi:MAG TPA: GNAT family N-acetyltransferase [Acidobacteriaceae bacterium]|nr:GNAT family N-acetyltransferase [Acidobacteriaceae bacterium]
MRDSAPETLSRAGEMLLQYGQFVLEHAGVCHFGSLDAEAARLPESYLEQGGGCLLAWDGETAAGFVAWRALPAIDGGRSWEMKRLWVGPAARGRGLGRILTEAVIERATAAGQQALFLNTAPEFMPAAQRIYRQLGFLPCPSQDRDPFPGIVWLRKAL